MNLLTPLINSARDGGIAYNRQSNGSEDEYYHAGGLDPWTLEKAMQSTGFAFIDARRADIIEYAFRLKGGDDKIPMLTKIREDLIKAQDNAKAAVAEIDRILDIFEKDEEDRLQGQLTFGFAERPDVDGSFADIVKFHREVKLKPVQLDLPMVVGDIQ